MVLPSCRPSLEGTQSSLPDQNNNISSEASRIGNVQQFEQRGHLVKLDLSDGTSLYTKLVVILNPHLRIFAQLPLDMLFISALMVNKLVNY